MTPIRSRRPAPPVLMATLALGFAAPAWAGPQDALEALLGPPPPAASAVRPESRSESRSESPPETPDEARARAERDARLQALGETYRRAPDDSQDPQELVRTRILNAEILAQNALAENQERADRAAYEAAAARHAEALARAEAARARHEVETREAEAALARHQADMAAWRAHAAARAAACAAGDRRAC